jgi:holo-[acyl-carrier protein] synthase
VIVGIGVDVCEVAHWQAAVARHPGIATRVLTAQEADRPAQSQAARFAAKEALVKALGGPSGLHWADAEVVIDEHGAPSFRLSGTVAEAARQRGIDAVHLSLSHDGGLAIAMVVCERS